MNTRTTLIAVAAGAVLVSLGYGLYHAGLSAGRGSAPPTTGAETAMQKAGDIDPTTGKRVLYWHDPMTPAQKFQHPGKSPFMDMQLVPVEEGADGGGGVTISPRIEQNLGVRTAQVAHGRIAATVSAAATVGYDERNVELVQARANGYVEHLYVRATLDPVRKGQALADLYVPDWVAAQEEYLSVRHLQSAAAADLLPAARQRMRLVGMTEEQIARVEANATVQPRLTLSAPIDGVVSELNAREGMTVTSGAPLFRINGLATVWVNADVPEALAQRVRTGDAVKAHTPALPGVVFDGRVGAVLPDVSPMTRTLKVRIELANRERRLAPGMFVNVEFADAAPREALLVPSEAVIETGTRTVVLLAEGGGKFRPVNVEVGSEGGGQREVLSGLSEHQLVVVSGQFLIDSEASLKGTEARLQ
jgi:Cu(I)/Ag(I) efflux system membrane fusion protein